MQSRSELRKKIMTILYQIDIYQKNNMQYNIDEIIKEVSKTDNEFIKDTVYGVTTYQNDIDRFANKYLENWTIDRLGTTDRAILRIALFEMLYTDCPKIVAINEAIELAKTYSDGDVRKMINGALDKLYHDEGDING